MIVYVSDIGKIKRMAMAQSDVNSHIYSCALINGMARMHTLRCPCSGKDYRHWQLNTLQGSSDSELRACGWRPHFETCAICPVQYNALCFEASQPALLLVHQ